MQILFLTLMLTFGFQAKSEGSFLSKLQRVCSVVLGADKRVLGPQTINPNLKARATTFNAGRAHYHVNSKQSGELDFKVHSFSKSGSSVPFQLEALSGEPDEMALLPIVAVTENTDLSQVLWTELFPDVFDRDASQPRALSIRSLVNRLEFGAAEQRLALASNAFHFPVGELHPELTYFFYVKTKRDIYRFEIKTNRNRKYDWAFVRLTDFKSVSTNRDLQVDEQITHFGVGALANHSSHSALQSQIKIGQFITNTVAPLAGVLPSKYIRSLVEWLHQQRKEAYDLEEILGSFDRLFEEAQKPENQIVARNTILAGRGAINKALKKYGFSIDEFSPAELENSTKPRLRVELKGHVHISDVLTAFAMGRIIYEAEPFASLHHRWSHQALFLTAFNGMSERERAVFVDYMSTTVAGTAVLWPSWTILFDSRGPEVFSPRYWRDLIEFGLDRN